MQQSNYFDLKLQKIIILILLFLNLLFVGILKLNNYSVFIIFNPIDNKGALISRLSFEELSQRCKGISFGDYYKKPTLNIEYQKYSPTYLDSNKVVSYKKTYVISEALKKELANVTCNQLKVETLGIYDNKETLFSKIRANEKKSVYNKFHGKCAKISLNTYHNYPSVETLFITDDGYNISRTYIITPLLEKELKKVTCEDISSP